jgi:hypothetical protein
MEAYHLLASKNDPVVDAIRKDALVLIDPLENPDGRRASSSRTRRAARPCPMAIALPRSAMSRGPVAAPTTTCST